MTVTTIRTAGAAMLAALFAAPVGAVPISSLVVFGDSNVDIGRADDPVPGDGAFPPPNTVAGRSSDGPILPEFVSERVGVPQDNYAFGGATTGTVNIVGLLGNPDLLPTGTLSQIDEFEARLGGGSADPDALYLVWAGSNDLVFEDDFSAILDKADQAEVDQAIDGALANLATAATRLTDLGAQNIVLTTRTPRPDLSDAPSPSAETDPDELNDAAGRQLNAGIAELVGELGTSLASDVSLFDDYALIRDVIDASGSNGFEAYSDDPSQFCVNRADCSDLINFDAAHKTSAVHSVLADAFIARYDLEPLPAPIPLPASGLLLAAAGGLLGLRRIRRTG